MNPELADRLETLYAERLAPVPPPPTVTYLPVTPERAAFNASRLLAALHTPLAAERATVARLALETARRIQREQYEANVAEYIWLRDSYGYSSTQAVERLGLTPGQARRYERAREAAS